MSKEYKKIYRLLDELMIIRAESGINPEMLAERFGITKRTIFRDIETLQETGIPVTYDHETAGYAIGKEFFMPPVDLTYEEGLAVCSLLSHIAENGQIPFIEPAARAVTKIKSQMSDKLRSELDEVDQHIELKLASSSEGEEVRDVYERVRYAIAKRHALLCTYDSVSNTSDSNSTEQFIFKPYKLYFSKRAWYVYGYHDGRSAVRCLKLQRFSTMRQLEQPYEIPVDFSVTQHIGNAWRMIRGNESFEVILHFDADFAETIADTNWHKTQQIEYLQDGSLQFTCTVDGLDEIVWWVLSMGPHCKVLQPPALAQKIKDLATGILEQYSAPEPV